MKDRAEELRRPGDLARSRHSQPCEAASVARHGATFRVTVPPLPLAPRPHHGEAISSWMARVAARYDLTADHLASHVLARRPVGIHRVEHLDHRADAELELALATASRMTPDRIRALRIAGDDGSASCWHRLTSAWCPKCVRTDLLDTREVYERALWRLGCCVMCSVHGIPLEDRCSRCMAGARCRFSAVDGLLRLACTGCERLVDPAPHSAARGMIPSWARSASA